MYRERASERERERGLDDDEHNFEVSLRHLIIQLSYEIWDTSIIVVPLETYNNNMSYSYNIPDGSN